MHQVRSSAEADFQSLFRIGQLCAGHLLLNQEYPSTEAAWRTRIPALNLKVISSQSDAQRRSIRRSEAGRQICLNLNSDATVGYAGNNHSLDKSKYLSSGAIQTRQRGM